jgi:hypothetical protein
MLSPMVRPYSRNVTRSHPWPLRGGSDSMLHPALLQPRRKLVPTSDDNAEPLPNRILCESSLFKPMHHIWLRMSHVHVDVCRVPQCTEGTPTAIACAPGTYTEANNVMSVLWALRAHPAPQRHRVALLDDTALLQARQAASAPGRAFPAISASRAVRAMLLGHAVSGAELEPDVCISLCIVCVPHL